MSQVGHGGQVLGRLFPLQKHRAGLVVAARLLQPPGQAGQLGLDPIQVRALILHLRKLCHVINLHRHICPPDCSGKSLGVRRDISIPTFFYNIWL